jgi:transcriptional regulator with XRE-family HTH domain
LKRSSTPIPTSRRSTRTLRLRRAIVGQLRELREQRSWTADAVGVPRSATARLEWAGHSPRLETLHTVARVLGYDVDVRLKRRRVPVA